MTTEEYYAILKEKWEATDKNDLNAVKAYNEFRMMLRKTLNTNRGTQAQ